MSIWNHYLITEPKPFRLEDAERALQAVNPDFYIDADLVVLRNGDSEGDEIECAQITVDAVDAGHPMEDREWFDEVIATKQNWEYLAGVLDRTRTQVAIQLINVGLWESNPPHRTLRPLQDWLIENFEGVLYVEGGDFCNRQGLVS